MKKALGLCLVGLLAVPALAWAMPPAAAPAPVAAAKEARAEGRVERQAQLQEQQEKHMRLIRVVGLADALGLDEAGALRLAAALKPFDDRKKPLQDQMKADGEVLRKAAEGDKASEGQVDAALQRIFDTKNQLHAINREMLETVTKGMNAQQKAKVAVFLATHRTGPGMGMGMGMGMGEPGGWEHGR